MSTTIFWWLVALSSVSKALVGGENDVEPPKKVNCSSLPDGNYVWGCSHFYSTCANGIEYQQKCSLNLVFDPESNQCQSQPSTSICSLPDEKLFKAKPPFSCTGVDNGLYSDSPTCSNLYIACQEGQRFDLECSEGMVFVEKTGQCDYIDTCNTVINQGSVSVNHFWAPPLSPPPSDAYGSPSSSQSVPASAHFVTHSPVNCAGKSDGTIYPSSRTVCSPTFWRCINGKAFEYTCITGLYYSIDSNQCDSKAVIANCGGTPRPDPAAPSYPQTQLPQQTPALTSYSDSKAASMLISPPAVPATPAPFQQPSSSFFDSPVPLTQTPVSESVTRGRRAKRDTSDNDKASCKGFIVFFCTAEIHNNVQNEHPVKNSTDNSTKITTTYYSVDWKLGIAIGVLITVLVAVLLWCIYQKVKKDSGPIAWLMRLFTRSPHPTAPKDADPEGLQLSNLPPQGLPRPPPYYIPPSGLPGGRGGWRPSAGETNNADELDGQRRHFQPLVEHYNQPATEATYDQLRQSEQLLLQDAKAYLFHCRGGGLHGTMEACVTVFDAEYAVSAAHCFPYARPGNTYQIKHIDTPSTHASFYDVEVVHVPRDPDGEPDLIVFKVIGDKPLCLQVPRLTHAACGYPYFILGLSDSPRRKTYEPPFAVTYGRVASPHTDRFLETFVGGSGNNPGDSGGPVFAASHPPKLCGIVSGRSEKLTFTEKYTPEEALFNISDHPQPRSHILDIYHVDKVVERCRVKAATAPSKSASHSAHSTSASHSAHSTPSSHSAHSAPSSHSARSRPPSAGGAGDGSAGFASGHGRLGGKSPPPPRSNLHRM